MLAAGMYDHRNDTEVHGADYFDLPTDYKNVAGDPALATVRTQLAGQLLAAAQKTWRPFPK